MAGGKETPRQKMIGMMYLVLTAAFGVERIKVHFASLRYSKRKFSANH